MPSVSKKQQKFMGIVRAIQKGEADPSDFNKDAQDAAKKMKKSSVKKYAKTKHKGLPTKKVSEDKFKKLPGKVVAKRMMSIKSLKPYASMIAKKKSVSTIDLERELPYDKVSVKDIDKVMKESVNEGRVLHFTQIKDKTLEKHLKVIAKKVGATVSKISGGFKVDADNDGRKLAQVVDYIFDKSLKKGLTSGGGMSRVQVVNESNGSKRDYKAEYKKFQSSPKAKKYRAELNKYNRQKGTYGNGDGKDASHKGGKIVGFEKESTNRGRAEKSRLKKEINDYVGSVIDETINENPAAIAAAQRMVVQSKGKKISVNTARGSRYKDKDPAAHKKAKSMFQKILDKFRKKNESQMLLQMAKQLKEADESVDEIKVWDLNEKCWKGYEKKGMKTMFGKRYPNCVKKKKSESVNEVSDKQKRKIYKKAFGKEYDDSKRKQAPLPLDIAYKVALNKLKKKKSESVNEAVYKFRGYTNTQMDELDAMLARAGFKGTPDFNKMTWTTKDKNPKIAKIIKSKGGKKIKESVNERAWTPAQEKAVKELDKKFYKLIGKKGIEPYSYEASQMWTSGGFRKEMRKIFGKDVKESVNENISDSEKFKIYNSLKKGDIVSIKYDSSIARGSKFHPFLVTKGKTKLMKGRIERIIMVPAGGSKAKRYLYNRGGRISLALGDMAASIIDMKKGKVNESVNESKELTKIDKMLKDKIKQIGKKDKQRALKLMKIYKDHWLEFSIKAKQHMNEAFAIQYKKDKRYLTRKELFDKKPLKFKTEDEAKSMLNGLDYKYRTNYKIVKIKEGTCGYGVDGKLGEEPAGPHLMKKIKKIRKKDVNEARLDPKQLLQQLGGNRFIAMTGAKNLVVDRAKNTLHMKIGRNSKGVSHLRIKLTGADLYDMEFLQVRAGNVKVKAKETGLYADQLRKMFTKHTGMYTSL